ncbi:hypothetical protein [Alteromonas sp. BMJM2]|uniref:hypothetical protein n=1 Tax=Alteromonas sp. BMJM2 TaxID=2954241 RepID=UPI0022B5B030|nr:hypothetical protein [Alteromonas sp. BMJM2]
MNAEQEIKQIELGQKEAQRLVDEAKSAESLKKNRHFNRIVHENYFKTEPARLTMLLTDPEFQDEASQADIHSRLRAIAHFRDFIKTVTFVGSQAEGALDDMDKALEEIRAEEDEA